MTRAMLTTTIILIALVVTAKTFGDSREDIHASPAETQPLAEGMPAPAFEVRDVHGAPFRFDPGEMDKPLVLTFYRGGWCPFCNLHLAELRHAVPALQEMGFDAWFVSIDLPEVLRPSLDYPELDFTLLSDSKLDATRAYGLAYTLDEETRLRYLRNDMDIEAASGENHHVLPVPATFIVGTDGLISFAYTNINYRVRIHPVVLLAAARAYLEGEDQRLVRQREAQREENR